MKKILIAVITVCTFATAIVVVMTNMRSRSNHAAIDIDELILSGIPIDQPQLFSPAAWSKSSVALHRAKALFSLGKTDEAMKEIDSAAVR